MNMTLSAMVLGFTELIKYSKKNIIEFQLEHIIFSSYLLFLELRGLQCSEF